MATFLLGRSLSCSFFFFNYPPWSTPLQEGNPSAPQPVLGCFTWAFTWVRVDQLWKTRSHVPWECFCSL